MQKKSIIALSLVLSFLTTGCGTKTIENDEPETIATAAIDTDYQEETTTTDPNVEVYTPAVEDQNTDDTTETTVTDSKAEQLLDSMSLEEKVYQMFVITPEALTGVDTCVSAGETTEECIDATHVGGIIYFSKNLETVDQTMEMLSNTQEYALADNGVGMFLCVDEEGGTVARCADKLGTTAFDDMSVYGEQNDADTAYNIGATIASDLSALGFNVDFAPVADVDINEGNELGTRIFSSDAAVVSNMVSAEVRGMQANGVSATLKHFPGLGAEDGNAHEDAVVTIDRTLDQLREEEFLPFQSGIESGADFVMVSHQVVTGVGDNLPADLSYTVVTELLKEELGFQGLAITDSQGMGTISQTYSSGEAAVLSVQAGIDIILMPADFTEAATAVYDAVNDGTISEERIDESVLKILEQKEEMGLLA